MKWCFLFSLIAAANSYCTEVLHPKAVRVNFVLPFSLDLSPAVGWLDVQGCAKAAEGEVPDCGGSIARIPLSEVRSQTPLETEFLTDGTLLLKQTLTPNPKAKSEDKNPQVVWARQVPEDGWYQPVELCKWPDAPHPCGYRIEIDPSTQTVQIHLFRKK